tara:strand:- start:748 stop:2148 length:1401 start_codon:yes stop_codon:yes gene_type:complete
MNFVFKRWLPVLALFVGAFLLTLDASVGMVTLWLTTDTYMHGMFVLPLAFILAKSRPLPGTIPTPLPLWQVFLLASVWALFMLFGHLSMLNIVQQAMLIGLIPLVVISCYGWRIAAHYSAPLILCFFAVPIGDFLIPALQSITADMSVYLLQLSGVSVIRNGWYISIPAADFRVAEACSGVNFLISTFTLSVFYAFFYMEKAYKRVVFIVLGFVVPIIANGIRVYLIIMIADLGHVEAATGFDHLVYGWIFFVVILIALFFIGMKMQDPEPPKCESGIILDAKPMKIGLTPISVLLLVTVGIGTFLFTSSSPELESKPYLLGKTLSKVDILGPQFPAADSVTYANDESGWRVYEIFYANESIDKKIIGYQNRWFNGKVWSVESKKKINVSSGIDMNLWSLADIRGRKYNLVFAYCIDGHWSTTSMETKARQFLARLTQSDMGGRAYAWFADENLDLNKIDIANTCQ